MIAESYSTPSVSETTTAATPPVQRSDLSANAPSGSAGKRSSVGRSSFAALAALRAENDDLKRRLEEADAQLVVAATVGQSLLKEHDSLRARLNETESLSDESGSHKRGSFDHLRGLEDDLNAMGSSLKGFVGSLSRPASPEGARELKTRTRVLQNESPKLSRRLSKKGFLKPQSPRKLAARSNKFVDMELASDIDNHLIHQVRNLRQELSVANEENRELSDSVARLESQVEAARKQRQKDLHLASKKDERIWDLELQTQQLRDSATKAETEAARMVNSLRQMDSAYGESVDAMAAMRSADSQKLDSFDAMRARLDGEVRRSRDLINALQSANASLTQRCTDLRREADALRARRNSTAPQTEFKEQPETETSDVDRPSSPLPSPHPPSPERSPTKQTLFVESLSSSLSHAHAQILELEEAARESELERQELLKLLNEAQETIESLNEMRATTPPAISLRDVSNETRPDGRSRLPVADGLIKSSKKIARNLLNEFQEALASSQKDDFSGTADADGQSVDAQRSAERSLSQPMIVDLRTDPDPSPLKHGPPSVDEIHLGGSGFVVEQSTLNPLQPKALAPAVEHETFVPTAFHQARAAGIPVDPNTELTADSALTTVQQQPLGPQIPAKAGGKYSLAVTKAQDKLMVQLEEIVDRRDVELVLCVDGCMQTAEVGDEPCGVFAQGQPSVLTIKQRPKVSSAMQHTLVNGESTMNSSMVNDWIPRALSTPILSSAREPDTRERATSERADAGHLPSPTKISPAQRHALNAWGTQYLPSKDSPMPWPISPGHATLRNPQQQPDGAKSGSAIAGSSDLSPSAFDGNDKDAAPTASVTSAILSGAQNDSEEHATSTAEPQSCDQSGDLLLASTLSAHASPVSGPADLEAAGMGPSTVDELSASFDPEESDWQGDDPSHDAISTNSIVSSTTERRLMEAGLDSPPKPVARRIRRTGHGSVRGAPRPPMQRGGAAAMHPLPTLLQSVKTFASLRSLGSSNVALSEGSKGSVEDKSDRDIRSLTHTMIGSWFQKFNRHNRKPKLRYFWVNPYSRALNWAPKPPSQGKKNMQTKTVFISSLRWKEPDRSYRNYPPGPDHAIVIVTPHREVRVVPTSWNDFEMWIAGLSLLLKRTHRNRPLHEQFGITDRAYADGTEDEDEYDDALALPGNPGTLFDQKDELRSKSMVELSPRHPTQDNSDYRDTEMTLDELGASILERHRAPAVPVGQNKGPPILRRNSLWASMQDLTRGNKSGLPRPTATASGSSLLKSTGSDSSSISILSARQEMSLPDTSTPKQSSGLPIVPHTVASAPRRPADLQQPPLHRRPSFGDMLLTATRRFSRSDLSSRRRSTLIETTNVTNAESLDGAPPIPTAPHRSASSSSIALDPLTEARRPALTSRKSVGAVMRDKIRNISGNSFGADSSEPPLPASEHFVPGARHDP
ncbi:hypothetical protein HDU86_005058 [Geranomyces michiganensis]|nr:hypothetical protein HDU86_005058 [Geranomyces michiganensis]